MGNDISNDIFKKVPIMPHTTNYTLLQHTFKQQQHEHHNAIATQERHRGPEENRRPPLPRTESFGCCRFCPMLLAPRAETS
jgi:hypothetical protein